MQHNHLLSWIIFKNMCFAVRHACNNQSINQWSELEGAQTVHISAKWMSGGHVTLAMPAFPTFCKGSSRLSLGIRTSDLKSEPLTILEQSALNWQKFRGSRDPNHTSFLKNFKGSCLDSPSVPGKGFYNEGHKPRWPETCFLKERRYDWICREFGNFLKVCH